MALDIVLRGPTGFNIAFAVTGYTLTADGGSITLTGTSASLEAGYKIGASGGSYAVTGTDATLTYTPLSGDWDPITGLTTGPIGWWDAADYATLSLSTVEVVGWANKGTAAPDGDFNISSDPGTVPEYDATGFNTSYPGIVFSTNDDIRTEDSSIIPWTGAHSVFVVLKDDGATTNYRTIYATTQTSGDEYALMFRASNRKLHLTEPGISGDDSIDEFTSGGPGQLSFITAAGISSGTITGNVYFDGEVDSGGTLSNSGYSVGTFVGMSLATHGYVSSPLACTIAEVLVFDYDVGTDDRQKIEGYLAHKWGIDGRLDAGHPYKSGPPTLSSGYTITADPGSYTVTGISASLEFGREVIAGAGSYTTTGTAASLEYGREVIALGGSYAVTGTAATLRAARRIVAAAGTYTVTGTAASLEFGREVIALGGSYALTGTAASLEYGREVIAAGGSYTLAGTAATLSVDRLILATGGSYTLTGTAATFVRGRRIAADGSSYAITGAAATFDVARDLTASGGTYGLTGTAATLRATRELAVDGGSYAVTGIDATLVKTGNYALNAETGAYVLTGVAASLIGLRIIHAEQGTLSLTGSDATLIKLTNYAIGADGGVYAITGTDADLTYDPVAPEPDIEPARGGSSVAKRKPKKAKKSKAKKADVADAKPDIEPAPSAPLPRLDGQIGALLDGFGTIDADDADDADANSAELAAKARRQATRERVIAQREAYLKARAAEEARLAYEAWLAQDDEEAMMALLPFI